MKKHNISDERKCWNTARERERLRARFQIKQRVSSLATVERNLQEEVVAEKLSQQDAELVSDVISFVRKGDTSKFSLSLIDRHFDLFSSPLSTGFLESNLPHSLQLCTAWFGKEYANMLGSYIESLASFSFMEYAVWLGK
eukprot:scaffold3598_cov115-Cylindrotheca_fusiformis.AAC.16